ncbi:hypothetical protein LQR30_22950 [Chromobacterium piscinae]|uniref:glycoside hydrolase family 108 protein n=1 Tax=Chromobacterium piscinae TaxID=686831 RepID=UPI001E5890AF|nr:glycosyl hydrolase 108 family protein [Chromobacterium piscinae]MCD4506931.1 hypothetical protein [Chromobacterium piscinae]
MNFETAFNRIMRHEGTYSNHPQDKGGETQWGITKAVAKKHGYQGEMHNLSQEQAKEIYRLSYWDALHCDKLPLSVSFQIFDSAINHGITATIKLIQRTVEEKDDGIWGPKTDAAIHSIPPTIFILAFNAARLEYYSNLNGFKHFGKGWARRLAKNLCYSIEDTK